MNRNHIITTESNIKGERKKWSPSLSTDNIIAGIKEKKDANYGRRDLTRHHWIASLSKEENQQDDVNDEAASSSTIVLPTLVRTMGNNKKPFVNDGNTISSCLKSSAQSFATASNSGRKTLSNQRWLPRRNKIDSEFMFTSKKSVFGPSTGKGKTKRHENGFNPTNQQLKLGTRNQNCHFVLPHIKNTKEHTNFYSAVSMATTANTDQNDNGNECKAKTRKVQFYDNVTEHIYTPEYEA